MAPKASSKRIPAESATRSVGRPRIQSPTASSQTSRRGRAPKVPTAKAGSRSRAQPAAPTKGQGQRGVSQRPASEAFRAALQPPAPATHRRRLRNDGSTPALGPEVEAHDIGQLVRGINVMAVLAGGGAGSHGVPVRRAATGSKHPKKLLKDSLTGITKGDVRRLARRSGCTRLAAQITAEAKAALKEFLRKTVGDAAVYTDYGKRKTVTFPDIIASLRRRGRIVYGR